MSKITHKQVQYLVYKLQDYGIVPSDISSEKYYTYENMTSEARVQFVDDIWQQAYGEKIEDMESDNFKKIIDIFSTAYSDKQKRDQLRTKLSKFIK